MVTGRAVLYAAIAANVAIAIVKWIAAGVTGSSAMLSEGIHSVIDTGDGLLLLLGTRFSRRPATAAHPHGSGLEAYFWTLVVAMTIFGAGGGVSFYEGVLHVTDPEPIKSPIWTYATLGAAVVFEGISWVLSIRGVRDRQRGGRTLWQTIRHSKDPSLFVVVFEDSAALIGLVLAGLGITLALVLDAPIYDGIASMAIGVLLMIIAVLLARECRSLILGEAADKAFQTSVRDLALAEPEIADALLPQTMHFGPEHVHVDLEVRFRPEITAADATRAAHHLESVLREKHPEIGRLWLRLL